MSLDLRSFSNSKAFDLCPINSTSSILSFPILSFLFDESRFSCLSLKECKAFVYHCDDFKLLRWSLRDVVWVCWSDFFFVNFISCFCWKIYTKAESKLLLIKYFFYFQWVEELIAHSNGKHFLTFSSKWLVFGGWMEARMEAKKFHEIVNLVNSASINFSLILISRNSFRSKHSLIVIQDK